MLNKKVFYNPLIMELSIFLAKVFGVAYVAIGLGALLNSKYYAKVAGDMMKSGQSMIAWALCSLVVGLVLVMYHNVWEASWVVILTIIGWILLVKGALLLLFPKLVGMFEGCCKKSGMIVFSGVVALVLGLVLGYFGFFA